MSHLFSSLAGKKIVGGRSIEDMIKKLKKPRRVMMLVKAGGAVDAFIEQLLPHLEKGDIIIDGGNSEYLDTRVLNNYCTYIEFEQWVWYDLYVVM